VCSKETGSFSNEIAAVENTFKTADKREKDVDLLLIKIKCNTNEYYPEKDILGRPTFKNGEKQFFQLCDVQYITLTILKSCVYRHTVILNSLFHTKALLS
jgi:hypothetical protein